MIASMNQTHGVLASGVLNNISQSSCMSSELLITTFGSLDLVRKLHHKRLVPRFSQDHKYNSVACSIEGIGSSQGSCHYSLLGAADSQQICNLVVVMIPHLSSLAKMLWTLFLQVGEYLLPDCDSYSYLTAIKAETRFQFKALVGCLKFL
jgi:hypothetical protein